MPFPSPYVLVIVLFSSSVPNFFCANPSLPNEDQNDAPTPTNVSAAQQRPLIRITDEIDANQSPIPQQIGLANVPAKNQFSDGTQSPKQRTDQQGTDREGNVRNVVREVEQKLGLGPPRLDSQGLLSIQNTQDPINNNNRRGDLSQLLSPNSAELAPAIESSPSIGGTFPAQLFGAGIRGLPGTPLGGGIGGVQSLPSPALLAALLRQQRQRDQLGLQSSVGNSAGISTNLAALQTIQHQRQRDQQQQQQRQRVVQQQQQIQALLQQVALQQQQQQLLLRVAGRRQQRHEIVAAGNDRLNRAGQAGSFRSIFENGAPSSFAPPNPVSHPVSRLTRRRFLPRPLGPSFVGLPPSRRISPSTGFGGPTGGSVPTFLGTPQVSAPSIIAPVQPVQTSDRPRAFADSDLASLLQTLISAASSLANQQQNAFPNSATNNNLPMDRAMVVKLVTEGQRQQQPRKLEQILEQEQRILEVLERESERNQMVQSNRKELQAVQEQQQRILELLSQVTTLRQNMAEIGGQDSGDSTDETAKTHRKTPTKGNKRPKVSTHQQNLGDGENLLRELLRALSGIISPQGPLAPGNTQAQPLVPSAQIVQMPPPTTANFVGQIPQGNILRPNGQLQPQQLQQILELSQLGQFPQQQLQAVPGLSQQDQGNAGQGPIQQFVTVLDPRTGQQLTGEIEADGRGGTASAGQQQIDGLGIVDGEQLLSLVQRAQKAKEVTKKDEEEDGEDDDEGEDEGEEVEEDEDGQRRDGDE